MRWYYVEERAGSPPHILLLHGRHGAAPPHIKSPPVPNGLLSEVFSPSVMLRAAAGPLLSVRPVLVLLLILLSGQLTVSFGSSIWRNMAEVSRTRQVFFSSSSYNQDVCGHVHVDPAELPKTSSWSSLIWKSLYKVVIILSRVKLLLIINVIILLHVTVLLKL